ncbi:lecithin retinol acyltransferase family protein [Thalassotalea aquiviva]|uniref:lecithin retinol acyltransferase family protein n=1 Tax=Thalassotalea aquiviva TaxID=3242415 RepID=UPI00352B797C
MFKYFLLAPAINLVESLVDEFRDSVTPKIGSVVYCDMCCGYADHSGIYVGNNQIIHLNGKGVIEQVNPTGFTDGTTALNIYVSAKDEYACGDEDVAERALDMLGTKTEYNTLSNNCHQFSAYCLNGDLHNACSFMWMLKDEAKSYLGANTWRHWG